MGRLCGSKAGPGANTALALLSIMMKSLSHQAEPFLRGPRLPYNVPVGAFSALILRHPMWMTQVKCPHRPQGTALQQLRRNWNGLMARDLILLAVLV